MPRVDIAAAIVAGEQRQFHDACDSGARGSAADRLVDVRLFTTRTATFGRLQRWTPEQAAAVAWIETITRTPELVPNYVEFQNDHVTACLSRQRFRHERDPQKSFSRMLANDGPATYRVYIGSDAFEGRVENFYGEGTFYRNLVADGMPDCAEKPPSDRLF